MNRLRAKVTCQRFSTPWGEDERFGVVVFDAWSHPVSFKEYTTELEVLKFLEGAGIDEGDVTWE